MDIQQEHKILKIAVAPHVVSLQRAMCTYPPFNELGWCHTFMTQELISLKLLVCSGATSVIKSLVGFKTWEKSNLWVSLLWPQQDNLAYNVMSSNKTFFGKSHVFPITTCQSNWRAKWGVQKFSTIYTLSLLMMMGEEKERERVTKKNI